MEEQEKYKDIIFLNSTHVGRANKFGEKLYLWFQAVNQLHPEAEFVGKVDDDTYVCSDELWPYLWNTITNKSYIGYQHTKPSMRMDELLVFIGSELLSTFVTTSLLSW